MATSKIPNADVPQRGVWANTDFDSVALTHSVELWLINDNAATYTNAPTGFSGRGAILGFQPVSGVYLVALYDNLNGKAWLRCKWWTSWNNWAEIT